MGPFLPQDVEVGQVVSLFIFRFSALVAGEYPEPVTSRRDRIEVLSPSSLFVSEGDLRRPW